MTRRSPLPDDLRGTAFSAAAARRAGVSRNRLRGKDLLRPWHGVRAAERADDALGRCSQYASRLRPGQFFTHTTAAQLHGLPLPIALEEDEAVHVGAVRPADAPHAAGVVGHRVGALPPLAAVSGMPVVAAHAVFCQLGRDLGFEDLVVIADVLLNATEVDEAVARSLLRAQVGAVRRVGSARLLRAVDSARRGSRSPAETRVRLLLDAAGIPAPELNARILDADGRSLGSPDFVWRAQRVVLEYEGDGHRGQEQFRYDVRRYEDLADAGWRVLRATADDLTAEGRRRLVQRVRAALG
ncbi:DUF559 domain-containing protein [Amnibacterium endophyticum]|uniref:DUF559 domain-containing protein n=1 Tax=Amnibacterium endophyticum TaxID=2109337 RepID=A0ABW4LF58_9MICO